MDILSQLAEKYKTDKGLWHHGYTPIYHSYFESLKDKPISLLEIGIGGYEFPDKGGESLRMWREYFAAASITGFDVYKKNLDIPNTTILQGSQIDAVFLQSLSHPFDIIIDDGSHHNEHTVFSFIYLFTLMNSGGIYVVEDTECSYWAEHYGGSTHPQAVTTMNYFKVLADSLNSASGMDNNYGIKSIHFYKGLIFIFKQ